MQQLVDTASVRPVRATLAALCANLVGIGLARFGYTPLIPALIAAGWFSPSDAVYLGAANLAGYLAGALGARLVATRLGSALTVRSAMALTTISLFACAFPFGFAWFFVWRFLSGATGGVAMALAAPMVIPHIPAGRRGLASGAIFTGVGLGIAASGTLVPFLMTWGLVTTWLGLAATAFLLTVFAWSGWPEAAPTATVNSPQQSRPATTQLRMLYLEYALNAVGLVPHMVFLVDFIARGLSYGLHAAAQYWVLFGIGALVGPLIGGHLGDRFGFAGALRLSFVVQAACVALPLISVSMPALAVSSFVIGAFVPGIVAVTIGRMHELLPHDTAAQAVAWGLCTTAFAVGQAIAGYGFSYIFARSGGEYVVLFLLAALALLLALALDFAAASWRGQASKTESPTMPPPAVRG